MWVGDKPFKEVFPRLYNLSARKDGVIRDMGVWSEGRWEWRVDWRTGLLEREAELVNLISSVPLVAGAVDRWVLGEGHEWDVHGEEGVQRVR